MLKIIQAARGFFLEKKNDYFRHESLNFSGNLFSSKISIEVLPLPGNSVISALTMGAWRILWRLIPSVPIVIKKVLLVFWEMNIQ